MSKYAVVAWTVSDLLTLRPDWTDEEAEVWLQDNSKYIQEAMVKCGWDAMEDLLSFEEGVHHEM